MSSPHHDKFYNDLPDIAEDHPEQANWIVWHSARLGLPAKFPFDSDRITDTMHSISRQSPTGLDSPAMLKIIAAMIVHCIKGLRVYMTAQSEYIEPTNFLNCDGSFLGSSLNELIADADDEEDYDIIKTLLGWFLQALTAGAKTIGIHTERMKDVFVAALEDSLFAVREIEEGQEQAAPDFMAYMENLATQQQQTLGQLKEFDTMFSALAASTTLKTHHLREDMEGLQEEIALQLAETVPYGDFHKLVADVQQYAQKVQAVPGIEEQQEFQDFLADSLQRDIHNLIAEKTEHTDEQVETLFQRTTALFEQKEEHFAQFSLDSDTKAKQLEELYTIVTSMTTKRGTSSQQAIRSEKAQQSVLAAEEAAATAQAAVQAIRAQAQELMDRKQEDDEQLVALRDCYIVLNRSFADSLEDQGKFRREVETALHGQGGAVAAIHDKLVSEDGRLSQHVTQVDRKVSAQGLDLRGSETRLRALETYSRATVSKTEMKREMSALISSEASRAAIQGQVRDYLRSEEGACFLREFINKEVREYPPVPDPSPDPTDPRTAFGFNKSTAPAASDTPSMTLEARVAEIDKRLKAAENNLGRPLDKPSKQCCDPCEHMERMNEVTGQHQSDLQELQKEVARALRESDAAMSAAARASGKVGVSYEDLHAALRSFDCSQNIADLDERVAACEQNPNDNDKVYAGAEDAAVAMKLVGAHVEALQNSVNAINTELVSTNSRVSTAVNRPCCRPCPRMDKVESEIKKLVPLLNQQMRQPTLQPQLAPQAQAAGLSTPVAALFPGLTTTSPLRSITGFTPTGRSTQIIPPDLFAPYVAPPAGTDEVSVAQNIVDEQMRERRMFNVMLSFFDVRLAQQPYQLVPSLFFPLKEEIRHCCIAVWIQLSMPSALLKTFSSPAGGLASDAEIKSAYAPGTSGGASFPLTYADKVPRLFAKLISVTEATYNELQKMDPRDRAAGLMRWLAARLEKDASARFSFPEASDADCILTAEAWLAAETAVATHQPLEDRYMRALLQVYIISTIIGEAVNDVAQAYHVPGTKMAEYAKKRAEAGIFFYACIRAACSPLSVTAHTDAKLFFNTHESVTAKYEHTYSKQLFPNDDFPVDGKIFVRSFLFRPVYFAWDSEDEDELVSTEGCSDTASISSTTHTPEKASSNSASAKENAKHEVVRSTPSPPCIDNDLQLAHPAISPHWHQTRTPTLRAVSPLSTGSRVLPSTADIIPFGDYVKQSTARQPPPPYGWPGHSGPEFAAARYASSVHRESNFSDPPIRVMGKNQEHEIAPAPAALSVPAPAQDKESAWSTADINAFRDLCTTFLVEQDERQVWIAVVWDWQDGEAEEEGVWVGRFVPTKRGKEGTEVYYISSLLPNGQLVPINSEPTPSNLLGEGLAVRHAAIYKGHLPSLRKTTLSGLSADQLAAFFPHLAHEESAADIINPCSVCSKKVAPQNFCSECATLAHASCLSPEGRCASCATYGPRAAAGSQPPASTSEAPAQMDNDTIMAESDEESDHGDDEDVINASERHPTADLPVDLPRRDGRIIKIESDKKGRQFAILLCTTEPRRVFLHSAEAAKGGIDLVINQAVSFLPVPSTAQPGGFTAIAIQKASFPTDRPDFRPVAVKKGVDLCELTFTQPPPEVNEAIEPPTQKARERIFRLVQDKIRTNRHLQQERVALACIRALYKIKNDQKWKVSTMETAMITFASVLNCLDAYSNAQRINLADWATWRMALRRIRKMKNLESVKQSAPATLKDIETAAARLGKRRRSAKLLLVIAWAHAGRASNVMTLTAKQFFNKARSVRWDKAKTTATIGRYTTHSTYGKFSTFVIREIAKYSDQDKPMFTKEDLKQVREELRALNPDFDLRSLRRGALTALAAAGHDDDTLLQFSQHLNVKNLYRYLLWGVKVGHRFQKGIRVAATALWKPAPQ